MSPAHREPGGTRFAMLFGIVAVLIAVSVIAIIVVTTGSDDDASDNRAVRDVGSAAAGTARVPSSTGPASSVPESSTSPASSAPKSSTSPVGKKSTLAKSPKAESPRKSPKKSITYTVKKGDNLFVIAAWFKLHGYGDLYERNKDVIGKDPRLIIPGQKITVSGRGMTVSGG